MYGYQSSQFPVGEVDFGHAAVALRTERTVNNGYSRIGELTIGTSRPLCPKDSASLS